MTTPTIRLCSECGKPLAADGGCPVCALKRALALSGQASEAPVMEQAGDRIGRYKLLEKIGEGGYGSVYMAEQAEPIRRRVALKIVKLGMDTKQVIARFEAERQALALMDHPNIAKVLDAGATDTGRPYFVMELVKGIKITDYCDQNHLNTKERLDLFIQVCHAIQHAHQKGIIHRDIKPSNVLVCSHDGVPVPKVIDFGIAKATQQPLTDKTVFTAFGQFIGTPAYMSPEQAGLSSLDIDTRTDIYSLGVLLYELLTGKPPFEPETLLKAGLDEMRRIIRETEPPKPSTKLATARAATPHSALSTLRSSATEDGRTPQLKEVRGDLDWIVMKCLEKDRGRRYETATGLAQDVERHLNNEPVTAAAPGAMYRMSKFVRRHRFGLATTAALVLLLAGGVVVSTWQMMRAKRAEKQASTVATFLEDMLNSVKPEEAKGKDTTLLREILDNAAARVDKELKDQPEVQASLRLTMGDAYLSLGQYDKARTALSAAQQAYKQRFGSRHLGYTRSTLGLAAVAAGKGNYPQAESFSREALAINRQLFGNDNTNVFNSFNDVANALAKQGKLKEAEPIFREVLEASERALGKEHPATLSSVNNLAALLCEISDYVGAETLFRRALEANERLLGKEHPDTLSSVNNLANLLLKKGDYAGAEPLFRRALEARERTLGKEHPDTLESVSSLAALFAQKDDYAGAEPLFRRVLEVCERTLGKEHPATFRSVSNLAALLSNKGDYVGAEPLYRRAVEANERLLGKEHPDTLMSGNNLANLLLKKGDYAGAEPLFRRALEARERTLGKEHPDTLDSVNGLAALLCAKGDYAVAEPLYRRALAARERTLGKEHPDTLNSVNNLARLLYKKGENLGAVLLFRRALEARERILGKEHPDTLSSVNGLAASLEAKGDYAVAEPLYRRALEARERILGKEHPDTLSSVNGLAALLEAKGDYAVAEPLFRRALEAQGRTLGQEHPDTLASVNNLAALLCKEGDNARAEPLYRRALEARERTLGKEHPDTLRSMNNLGALLAERGDYAEAGSLFRRALEAMERTLGKEHPDTLSIVNNLAASLLEQGKLAEAMALARRSMRVQFGLGSRDRQSRENALAAIVQAIEKDPHPGKYLMFRAFVYGQQGQWQAAANDLSQVANADVRWSLCLGPLLVEIGDTNGHNRHRSLVSVTSWGEDPETTAEAAMEMSLRPSDRSWSVPAQLAETAVVGGTNHLRLPYFQLVKGLVEYRQGHYASARDWAQKSLAGSGTNYTTAVSAGVVLAMAQQQLKQPDEARKALAQATEVSETKLPKVESGDLGESWPEWLVARILLREAKGLIETK